MATEFICIFYFWLKEFFPPNKQTQEMFEKHFNAHGLEKLVAFQVRIKLASKQESEK